MLGVFVCGKMVGQRPTTAGEISELTEIGGYSKMYDRTTHTTETLTAMLGFFVCEKIVGQRPTMAGECTTGRPTPQKPGQQCWEFLFAERFLNDQPTCFSNASCTNWLSEMPC